MKNRPDIYWGPIDAKDEPDASFKEKFVECSLRWTPSAGQFGRAFKVCSSLFCYPSSCGLQGRRCAEV